MNISDKSSHPEEGMLGNSTWNYGHLHQNYTLSPPLIPDKTSTSKPAACEQLHIAIEVWTAYVPLNTTMFTFLDNTNFEYISYFMLYTSLLSPD